jgi:mono/diheme cytochrome c family protein
MRASYCLLATALVVALVACQPASTPEAAAPAAASTIATATGGLTDEQLVERGEYLVRIAGCNDCHTPGYAEAAGDVGKDRWLIGSQLGWNGPWGTTYAANLRLKAADLDDAKWLEYSANLHTRPPMPDFAVRDMTQTDRLAIFRLIKSLSVAGDPAPAYLPPGQEPPLPHVAFNLPAPPTSAGTSAAPAAATTSAAPAATATTAAPAAPGTP